MADDFFFKRKSPGKILNLASHLERYNLDEWLVFLKTEIEM